MPEEFIDYSERPSFKDQIEQILTKLDDAVVNLISAVDNFPVGRREEVIFLEWSLKDMLAHFSGWNIATIEGLNSILEGRADQIKPWIQESEIDDFNAK